MTHHDDLRIARALASGDGQRFDEFFDEIFPRLYRFVLARVRGDAEQAREICQQTLVRAMEYLDRYRGEAALYTWICKIALNTLSDHWEYLARERERVVPLDADSRTRASVDASQAPLHLQPERQRVDIELSQLVLSALDHLPAHYSRVLEWKYVEGLSVQDMSRRLGHPLLATQSLLWRARANFREVFTRLAGGEAAPLLHD